jgi:hypothetical protein
MVLELQALCGMIRESHVGKDGRADLPLLEPGLASISAELLAAQFPLRKGVRLIGVSLSSLCAESLEVDPQVALAL